jgi:hypothetical protein
LNAIYDGANGAQENGVSELITNVYTPCAAIPAATILDHVSDLIDDGICSLEDANGWGEATVAQCVDVNQQCTTVQAAGIPCRQLRGQCDLTCRFCRAPPPPPPGGGGRFLQAMNHRRMQDDHSCDTAHLTSNYQRIDTVCCDDTNGVCTTGVPTSCDAKCAVFFVDLYDRCQTQLHATAGAQASVQLDALYHTCTTALPTEQLLQLASVCEGGNGGTGGCQVKATLGRSSRTVIYWINTQSHSVNFYYRSNPSASWHRFVSRTVYGTGQWSTHSGDFTRGRTNYEYSVTIDGTRLGPWSEPANLLDQTHLSDAACVLTQVSADPYSTNTGHYCRTQEYSHSGPGNGSPPRPGVYTSMASAQAACTADSSCHSVYDNRCDGTGSFYTCTSAVGTRSSIGSCLSVKSAQAQVIVPPAPWTKVTDTFCGSSQQITVNGRHPRFTTRQLAEASCLSDPTCLSVYDASCDGRGNWYACTTTTGSHSSIGSCLYLKGANSQASGGILPYGVGGNCDVHTLATRISNLNHACCLGESGSSCTPGVCSVDCGMALLPLLDECRPLLDAIYDDVDSVQDGTAAVFDTLNTRCMSVPATDALQRVVELHNAGKCGNEILNGVGEMHVTNCQDRNRQCASVLATGIPCTNLVGQCDLSCHFCVANTRGRRLQGATTTIHVINAQNQCGESTFPSAWTQQATQWAGSQGLAVQVGTCVSAGYTVRTGSTTTVPNTGAPGPVIVTLYSRPVCNTALLQRNIAQINAVCCDATSGRCAQGVPTTCDAKCAVFFVPLYQNCSTNIAALNPAMAPQLQSLNLVCTNALPVDDLLMVAARCSAPAPPAPPTPTPGYTLRADHFCSSSHRYPNLRAAQRACNRSSTCLSISDQACDGTGTYYTCTTGTGSTSRAGSCMYVKAGAPGHAAAPAPPGYALLPNHYCAGQGSYGSLAAAGAACDRSSTCTALYDGRCDGTGTFNTCRARPARGFPNSTSGSCLYTKGPSPPPAPSAPGYTLLRNHYCTGTGRYPTLAQAQAACTASPTCLAVDDGSCDGTGVFITCTTATGSASRAGSCMLVKTTGSPTLTNDCNPAAIDLATLTSPHSGTTRGRSSGYTAPVGSGPQIIFVVTMAPGARIDIGQTRNSFDSEVTVAYGGHCPGQHRIQAWDDPDTRRVRWHNTQSSPQIMYFVIDGYGGRSGTFTLSWTITGNGAVAPPPPSSTLYTQRLTHYCDDSHEIANYPTLQAAEAACSASSSCRSVEDESCDGRGQFHTCSTATGTRSGAGTCLYVKALAAAPYANFSNHYCPTNQYVSQTTYPSVTSAEAACTASPICHSVYDDRCDGTGRFRLCKSRTGTRSSIHSCLLVKQGGNGNPTGPPPPPQGGTHYSLTPNHYCTTRQFDGTATYTSLHAAEAACTARSTCTGVYDDGCNNRGTFHLCNNARGTASRAGSCLYNKGRATPCCSTHGSQCGCSRTRRGGCHTDICACGRGVCGQVGSRTVTSAHNRYPYICDATC